MTIAAEVVQKLPLVYKIDGRISGLHLAVTYGLHGTIFAKVDSQIVHKMLDLGYALSTENMMLRNE